MSFGSGAGEFIDTYVFPEGELPHLSLALKEMSGAGLEVTDAESLRRHYARTYPTAVPLLRADRIYARGFSVVRAEVHHGLPWSRISDHAALSAELELS